MASVRNNCTLWNFAEYIFTANEVRSTAMVVMGRGHGWMDAWPHPWAVCVDVCGNGGWELGCRTKMSETFSSGKWLRLGRSHHIKLDGFELCDGSWSALCWWKYKTRVSINRACCLESVPFDAASAFLWVNVVNWKKRTILWCLYMVDAPIKLIGQNVFARFYL